MDYNEYSFDNLESILLFKDLTIVQANIEWHKMLENIDSERRGLELLRKLEDENKNLKFEIGFEYINKQIRKKQFEVIGRLTQIVAIDWSDKNSKSALIDRYVINEIDTKKLGFKNFPQPIVPEYKNITIEHIEKMLEIIGVEYRTESID